MARCFYSVVQYCPDRFRAETVNVGLVLLCPNPHTVRVRMTSKHDRIRKVFGISKPALKDLALSTAGFETRVKKSRADLRTAEDLAAFAASRANDLRLTEPRLARLEDAEQDFERLFGELVEDRSALKLAEESTATILPPVLASVFEILQRQRKIWNPGTIVVPVFGRKLDVPYAYRNGVVNFVKPFMFASDRRAESQAANLAVNGDLIRKHSPQGEEQRLIIVSTNESPEREKEIGEHVQPLFNEYGVRLIRPSQVETFAREVEASAH